MGSTYKNEPVAHAVQLVLEPSHVRHALEQAAQSPVVVAYLYVITKTAKSEARQTVRRQTYVRGVGTA